ncbi:MAG: glycosyltransferase family 39 protein [Xenococcaceae cyanobacterium]
MNQVIICFGIIVRLAQYVYNRSLWADEATLALNIVDRSYLELFKPLDYEQGAPIGFLLIEKFFVQIFGNNEYALRLFPLLSACLSFLLLYKLAQKCLDRKAIPIALILFASLSDIVYYATEVKQYSNDATIALLLSLLLFPLDNLKLTRKKTFVLSILGGLSIWFSHPAIFVLAGMEFSALVILFRQKKSIFLINRSIIYITWLSSFALFYFISLTQLVGDRDLMTSWQKAFPESPFDLLWLLDAFGKFFHEPLGFDGITDGLAIIAFLIGCFACFSRNKSILLILLSPLLFTFLAAFLHQYPFRSRLVFFLNPFFVLLIAQGINYLKAIGHRKAKKTSFILGIFLLISLCFPPLVDAGTSIFHPKFKEEIKPVMNYVRERDKPNDVLYVFQRGIYQFKYYASMYGYREGDYIRGVEDLDKYDGKKLSEQEWLRYKQDLDSLRGNDRVWLLFSHSHVNAENEKIKSYLDEIGKQIDFYEDKGAYVYLYNLKLN